MKKYIFIFAALIVSLWSCQKDLDLYSGRDFIYFNPSAVWILPISHLLTWM